MPAHHRFREDWTPRRIQERAARVGPNVAIFAEVVMRERKHPEQGYRTCLGVIRLAEGFGRDRLDAACKRALEINARSYTSVQSILKNGLNGMAEAFAELQAQDAAADLSHAEWLGLLLDLEVASRETKRFEARMRSARLRRGPARKMSITAPGTASTRRCSRACSAANGSPKSAA